MALLTAMLLASCSGGDDDEAETGSFASGLESGGSGASDGWQVVNPQAGIEVSVEDVATDSVGGELPAGVERAGNPVRIELVDGTMPTEGVLLRRTLSTPVPAGRTPSLGYLDDRTDTWIPVRTRLSRDRTVLTARVYHFSFWDDLYHDIGSVAGTRFERPRCDGRIPAWAANVSFFDDDHSPVRWCAGSDPNDPNILVVKAAANRAYGFTVRPNADFAWVWSSAASDAGLSDALTWGLTATLRLPATLTDHLDGVALMPPGIQVHFGFTQDQVRSMEPGPLLSVESEFLFAVSGYMYTALTEALEHLPEPAAALVSAVVLLDCLSGFRNHTWAEVPSALWDCVVWNWHEVESVVNTTGKKLGLSKKDAKDLARRALWVAVALALVEAGTTIAEYVLDEKLLLPAEARVILAPGTRVVEINPFTPGGSIDAEYFVTQAPRPLDCSYAQASHASEEPGVYWCGYSSDAADVCWPVPATPADFVCGTTPWSKRLVRWSVKSPPTGALPPPAHVLPWGLILADGERCRVRNGGAWGGRSDGLVGWYSCGSSGKVVLANRNDFDGVVDDSSDTWTVQVGQIGDPTDDFPPPQHVAITKAFYAGG